VINHFQRARFILSAVAFLGLLISAGDLRAQTPIDCQTEIEESEGYVTLSNGATTNKKKEVDEWDEEVVKIRTARPGVLVIEGDGVGSQSTVYTAAASGPHPLLDSSQLGTDLRTLQAVVGAGDHCIQVATPPGATTGDFEIVATFIDVCPLGVADDHGDSLLCATSLTVGGSSVSGAIASGAENDIDIFTFVLSSSATVSIESTGSTDVEADLLNAGGSLLASDDDGGSSSNFNITTPLAAGRYYLRVKGTDGSYGLGAVVVP
jgi:hypothetical protein